MTTIDATTTFYALTAPTAGVCHECGYEWPYEGGDDRCPRCASKHTHVVDAETGRPLN